MSYSSRFWLYAPITIFLIIAGAVMAYWFVSADAFEKKLVGLKGREAIPGVTLDWDKVEMGGFPFRLDADFVKFSAQGAGAHGTFIWRAEKLALHTLTYNRRKTVYEAAGMQQMEWAGADEKIHLASFIAGSLRASTVTDGAGLRRFDLDGMNLVSQDFTIEKKHDFTIARFQFHLRRDPNGKNPDLMLQANDWNGRKLVQAYVSLTPGAPLMPLMAGDAAWPQAVAQWKAQGGKAKLSQVIAPGLDPNDLLSPLY